MGESETPEEMAYGVDSYEGTDCPAQVALGEVPNGDNLAVAERYDMIAADNEEFASGTISAEQAEEYWSQAVDHFEENGYTNLAEAGREIAEEVF